MYGPEEALIAYNEGKVDIHAIISVVVKDLASIRPRWESSQAYPDRRSAR